MPEHPDIVDLNTGRMVTYRRPDGELICGEFTFVLHEEFFEADDEPTELIREVWVRQEQQTVTLPERAWDDDDA